MANAPEGTVASLLLGQAEFKETIVNRDGNRPISFAGQELAQVSMDPFLSGLTLSAALYKTRGGKFVAALSKRNTLAYSMLALDDSDLARGGEFNKAQVFDSFEAALAWFRPGRLTDALRRKLGLDEPERIE